MVRPASNAKMVLLRVPSMARGNRHRLADHLWHLTERCHRRQFLLKFARDWRTWMK